MTYVLDSSAIAIIVKRLREDCIEALRDSVTLDLARYELGNIIWKECTLRGLINVSEAVARAGQIVKILDLMKMVCVEADKDFKEVMELATKLKLTFYDTSYLQLAKSKKHTIVTEDEELYEKAKQIGVKAIDVNGFIKRQGI